MTRIIVWSIVGLLVLAFIIFFLPMMRQSRQEQAAIKAMSTANIISDAEAYEKFISTSERDVRTFTNRIEKRKSKITNPTPSQQALLDNLDAKFTEFQTAVSELSSKTNKDEKEVAVNKVKELKKEIRSLIRDLGGSITQDKE